MIEYIGVGLNCLGAILVSYNTNKIRFIGYIFWIVANAMLAYYGYITQQLAFVFLYTFYQICNVNGLWSNREWK